jgi:hypothetical protein
LLPGGELLSLEEARRVFPVPIVQPDDDLASTSTIKELWVRQADAPEVYVVYESGVHMIVEPASAFPATTKEYGDAQIREGARGTFASISGVDVFLVEPAGTTFERGSATFVLGDAVITVIGSGATSLTEIQAIAEDTIRSGGS